jgi:uncharacterized protein YneF (UPF0154 family)
MMDHQKDLARQQSQEIREQNEEHEEEMRRITEQQTSEQERIATESHLNEIKRKLLEIAVEGVSHPKTASQKAMVIIQSPDFSDNAAWFWPAVSRNEFLKATFVSDLFSTVDENTDPAGFFDPMDNEIYNGVVDWIRKNPSAIPNGAIVLQKIDEFSDILKQREKDQQARDAAEQSALHLKQIKEKASRDSLGLMAIVLFSCSAIPVAWHVISLWLGALQTRENPKAWSVMLANAGSTPFASQVGVWSAILALLIGLVIGVFATWKGTDESDEDNMTFHVFFAFVGSVFLTVHFWNLVIDSRFHVAMVVACVILPFIPFVRLVLASLGGGMSLVYILVIPSWLIGCVFGSLTGYFTTSHPVQSPVPIRSH